MQMDMTKGRPLGMLLRFVIPVFIGNLFQQLYNMVDTIIVGRVLGPEALAAVGSTGTLFFLILGFSGGMSTGFTVVTSQRFGAGDEEGTHRSVATGILLSLVTAAVLTVVSSIILRPLLRVMNTPADIFENAYRYVSTICRGIVATMFYNLFSSYLRAVGNSRVPLYFLIFSSCLNIVLDYTFIAFLGMGTMGAAFATVVSQGIAAMGCGVYILRKMPVLTPGRGQWGIDKALASAQIGIGLPMALQNAITSSGTIIMQSAVNLFGSLAVAGTTAASKVHMLLGQGNFSMGMAVSTYVGQNFGAKEGGRIREGVKTASAIMCLYSLIGMTVMNFFLPDILPLFFSDASEVAALLPWAQTYARINSLFYIPLAMIFIYRGAIQSCGYGVRAMTMGLAELGARMVLAFTSMAVGSYALAVAADGAAWLVAGVYGIVLYLFTMRGVERNFQAAI